MSVQLIGDEELFRIHLSEKVILPKKERKEKEEKSKISTYYYKSLYKIKDL